MDRASALALLNRKILNAYSRRTTERLRAALPLRLALPHLEPVLAQNVAKEIKKDALVIRHASEAVATGTSLDPDALRVLLEATKEIDRTFLAQVSSLPIRIVIPYAEIVPVRLKRIERLFGAAYRVFEAWQPAHGLRAAVKTAYPRTELEPLLSGLLRLYAQETRVLSRAVRLPGLLVPLREHIAQSLHDIMSETATRLARELGAVVYRK